MGGGGCLHGDTGAEDRLGEEIKITPLVPGGCER